MTKQNGPALLESICCRKRDSKSTKKGRGEEGRGSEGRRRGREEGEGGRRGRREEGRGGREEGGRKREEGRGRRREEGEGGSVDAINNKRRRHGDRKGMG